MVKRINFYGKPLMKYHINPETGRPNQCTATVRDCKFAVDGELPEHYETKAEAQKAAEKMMSDEHGETSTLTKDKTSLQNKKTDIKEIVKTASVTNNHDEMLGMTDRGNYRVYGALANNPYATDDILNKIYDKSSHNESLQIKIAKHDNFSAEKLNADDFSKTLTNSNYKKRLGSDYITKEHVDNVLHNDKNRFYSDRVSAIANTAMINSNNHLSHDDISQFIHENNVPHLYVKNIIKNNEKYDFKKDVDNYSVQELSFMADYRNDKINNGLSKYVIDHSDNNDYRNLVIAGKILSTSDITSDDIEKIYYAYKDKRDFDHYEPSLKTSIAINVNTPDDIRKELFKDEPDLRRKYKVNQLKNKYPNIVNDITVNRKHERSTQYNFVHHDTISLDKDKIKEYGLNADDIKDLYSNKYNLDFTYDEKNGIIHGSTDTSG